MKISFKLKNKLSKHANDIIKTEIADNDISSMLRIGGSSFLSRLKQKAIRINNSWYRILSLEKRRFIDAVIQTVNKIRSPLLLKILTAHVEKLLRAIGGIRGLIGNLAYGMQNIGQPLAKKMSIIAQKWGNKTAAKWANDAGFIRYLTVIGMNNLPTSK